MPAARQRPTHRKGDLLVQVVVETPTKLTAEQEELFRKLAELEGHAAPAPRKGFFGKLKDLVSGDTLQRMSQSEPSVEATALLTEGIGRGAIALQDARN